MFCFFLKSVRQLIQSMEDKKNWKEVNVKDGYQEAGEEETCCLHVWNLILHDMPLNLQERKCQDLNKSRTKFMRSLPWGEKKKMKERTCFSLYFPVYDLLPTRICYALSFGLIIASPGIGFIILSIHDSPHILLHNMSLFFHTSCFLCFSLICSNFWSESRRRRKKGKKVLLEQHETWRRKREREKSDERGNERRSAHLHYIPSLDLLVVTNTRVVHKPFGFCFLSLWIPPLFSDDTPLLTLEFSPIFSVVEKKRNMTLVVISLKLQTVSVWSGLWCASELFESSCKFSSREPWLSSSLSRS